MIPNGLATILVAEEDELLRHALSIGLAADGYRVIAVEDGFELFDYLGLARAPHSRLPMPDVVVSDVELAGCDGLTACRRLRAQLPVVLITARDDASSAREALGAGAADIVPKPVDVDEVRGAVAILA